MVSSGMLRRVALVRADVSEEPDKTRRQEQPTYAAKKFLRSVRLLLVAACVVPSSPILITMMKEAPGSKKRRFLQEPHGVTSQKTPFFTVTAVKTSNLT
jgi:hypothetical protein